MHLSLTYPTQFGPKHGTWFKRLKKTRICNLAYSHLLQMYIEDPSNAAKAGSNTLRN